MTLRKGIFILFLFMFATLPIFSGCAAKDENTQETSQTNEGEKIQVFTTLFVTTDFSQKIGGDLVTVTNLVPPGMSPHDYEPTAKDMAALINGDVFVYNGAGLEGWVEKVVENLNGKNVKIVNTSEHVSLLEGVHNHDEEEHEEGEHEEDTHAVDPHIWTSPLNALKQAEEIKNALVEIDPSHSATYEANFKQLEESLIALDEQYKNELKNVKRKEFFVSHAAFGYLANQYGLTQISISGLIPADEPSPSELAGIIKQAKELEVKYILFDPTDVTKISEMVANEIGAKTAILHPVGSLSPKEIEEGQDYLSIMERNLSTLKTALNE